MPLWSKVVTVGGDLNSETVFQTDKNKRVLKTTHTLCHLRDATLLVCAESYSLTVSKINILEFNHSGPH